MEALKLRGDHTYRHVATADDVKGISPEEYERRKSVRYAEHTKRIQKKMRI